MRMDRRDEGKPWRCRVGDGLVPLTTSRRGRLQIVTLGRLGFETAPVLKKKKKRKRKRKRKKKKEKNERNCLVAVEISKWEPVPRVTLKVLDGSSFFPWFRSIFILLYFLILLFLL